jgi:uncharacterized membrane protein
VSLQPTRGSGTTGSVLQSTNGSRHDGSDRLDAPSEPVATSRASRRGRLREVTCVDATRSDRTEQHPPRTVTVTSRDPKRLITFSDGVFAISITLLVLGIHPPEDTRRLASGLAQLWPSYVAYVVSFLLIGQVWANHHAVFDHIRIADRPLFFLNTLLLMDVAFLPFVASVLATAFRSGHGERTAVIFYGATFGVGTIFFNAIWEYVRHGHRLLGPTIDPATALHVARRFRLGPVLYFAGGLLGAWLPTGGVIVFSVLIIVYWLPVKSEPRTRPKRGRAICGASSPPPAAP